MSNSTPEHEPLTTHRKAWVVYTTYGLILVGLLIVALTVFSNHQRNQDARVADERADQLQTQLTAAGLGENWDHDTIVQVLGSDGGRFCDGEQWSSLAEGVGLVNGAGGPGLRPSVADTDAGQAGRIVVQVYCPDQLADYDDWAESLHLTDTTSQDVE